jgi:hypothetical protein
VDDGARARENVRESVRICDTETNTLIHLGEVPGEALLGVPESIFMNTVFIRQIDGTRPGGSGILSSIENLLFSANEQISTEKAVERLDEARRQLLHKNEKGAVSLDPIGIRGGEAAPCFYGSAARGGLKAMTQSKGSHSEGSKGRLEGKARSESLQ